MAEKESRPIWKVSTSRKQSELEKLEGFGAPPPVPEAHKEAQKARYGAA